LPAEDFEADLAAISATLDIVIESTSSEDMCRRIVLGPANGQAFVGCHIQAIDKSGQLVPEASFGQELPENYKKAAEQAIFSRTLVFTPEIGENAAHVALPLTHANLPIAVAILVLKKGAQRQYISDLIAPQISKLVGYHLQQLRLQNRAPGIQTFSGAAHVSEITSRQIKILEFMAEGLTNAEISRKLLLSESTVRQESVRIYRIFNTDSRHAAVAAGREAGLIANLQLSA
jgi:DNA-binding CsgD family transcriptional regulator